MTLKHASILCSAALAFAGHAQTVDPAPAVEPPAVESKSSLVQTESLGTQTSSGSVATHADHDADAVAVFDRFVQTMKDARSISFKVVFSIDSTDSSTKDLFGPSSATVKALRTDKGWSYRITGTGRRTAKSEEVSFDLAYADGRVTYLDEAAKKMLNKPVASARGSKMFEAASNLRTLSDLFTPTPLAKERAASSLLKDEDAKVGETECHVVVVSGIQGPANSTGETRLSFGATDNLLRKIARERPIKKASTAMVLEFSEVVLSPSITAEDVELKLPEGYTKDAPPAAAAKPQMPAEAAEGTPKAVPIEQGSGPVSAPSSTLSIEPAGVSSTVLPGTTPPMITPEPGTAPTPAPTPNVPEASPNTDLGPAPFELRTLDGASVTLDTLRGQPAVVMFAGSWSLSTRKALPELQALEERYKGKARVYLAAVRQRDPKALAALVKEAGVEAPILVAADALAEQWRVAAFPALFIVGPEGEFLKKPTSSKIDVLFPEARAALDTALNMTPEPKAAAESATQSPEASTPENAEKGE
jgi:thiol-disulfide isomerase/thioredoxin